MGTGSGSAKLIDTTASWLQEPKTAAGAVVLLPAELECHQTFDQHCLLGHSRAGVSTLDIETRMRCDPPPVPLCRFIPLVYDPLTETGTGQLVF